MGGEPHATTVTVFHNNNRRDAMEFGYRPADSVTEVFSYHLDLAREVPSEVIADEAYRLFNVGHDPDFGIPDPRAAAYRARRNRSLSTGNIVRLRDDRTNNVDWLAITPLGWAELDAPPLIDNQLGHGTTPADALYYHDGSPVRTSSTFGGPED